MLDTQDSLTKMLYANYLTNTAGKSGTDSAEWFYQTRISGRKDASTLDWLNHLLKTGMIGLGHISNEMYRDLLDGHLSHQGFGHFLSEYYWGSGYGFQRIVLPATVKNATNEIWRAYIKSIIHEENTPESHCGLFKVFIESLGFEVGEMPQSAEDFNKKMLAGYGASLGHSLGYALAIETEADFQIALVFAALKTYYKDKVENTDYFRIHISEYGEELHAQETCMAIEQLLAQNLCTKTEIEQGFKRAIVDTRDYMSAIHKNISSVHSTTIDIDNNETSKNPGHSTMDPRFINTLIKIGELKSDFQLTADLRLQEDIGIDSLKLIDIVLQLEDEFGINLSEDALAQASTVGELWGEVAAA
ncbi:acyl carrier protein [Pseudomonas sp. NFACC02]|uniref:acyl carrier protein n=1 Tax=Pseudomonas sp. NFACC02 TaxID=1566250 RepID=UPI0008D867DB|nr:acyl carrier protein [Pseudomonas sp. NFACC02]SEQ54363.1 acyl carrier protein [Pseudomonas sp. NFACC02]